MNIYDISDKAGVSIATVSRVINKSARVSEKTKNKVLEVMRENGYTPNAFARGLGLNSMKTVGIMCADSSDPFIAKGIYHLERDLRQHGYDALLCCTGYDLKDKQNYLNLLLSKRADAIILVGSNFAEASPADNNYLRQAAKQLPIMMINGTIEGENIYSTLSDDDEGLRRAVESLYAQGRKHIHYLYNATSYSGINKLKGFLSASKAAFPDTAEAEARAHYINGNIIEAKTYLASLYNKQVPMDAIITSDDTLAIGALKFASEYDLDVPEVLSVIGYNNSIIAQCSVPELTSIDNRLETLCHTSVSNLMAVFHGMPVQETIIFPTTLIERGSTL